MAAASLIALPVAVAALDTASLVFSAASAAFAFNRSASDLTRASLLSAFASAASLPVFRSDSISFSLAITSCLTDSTLA